MDKGRKKQSEMKKKIKERSQSVCKCEDNDEKNINHCREEDV